MGKHPFKIDAICRRQARSDREVAGFAQSPSSPIIFIINHVDYIHYNPVHHGLVLSPKD